jgi:hypothetical protein
VIRSAQCQMFNHLSCLFALRARQLILQWLLVLGPQLNLKLSPNFGLSY